MWDNEASIALWGGYSYPDIRLINPTVLCGETTRLQQVV